MIDSGVSGPHPDHLDLLKQFSFRSDGRCNNDFRFLELSKIGGADISHTRRNGADQVLTSVVNVRRTEKDLPQSIGRLTTFAGNGRSSRNPRTVTVIPAATTIA